MKLILDKQVFNVNGGENGLKKPINIDYWYENTLFDKVELWMMLPKEGMNQSVKPKQVHRVPTGESLDK